MIKLLYSTTIYYRKNKKSRNAVFSLTILFLLITNLFYQINKSAKYYIKFELSNSAYQFNSSDNQIHFLKNFALYSVAKNLDQEEILYDVLSDYTLVVDEKFFFKIVDADFNQETINLNNTKSYLDLKKKLTNKFNLVIKNETIRSLNEDQKLKKMISELLPLNKINEVVFMSFINNHYTLNRIMSIDDIILIKIEKKFENILSSNQIILLNFFILCLLLFYPNLLIIFRKLRNSN